MVKRREGEFEPVSRDGEGARLSIPVSRNGEQGGG
jgi:hypothetical protein